ncbi:unnamed protein product [Somion occarium]|uniref:DUF6535 domain-containing protein n=1 Tax=Somion occarium TaxID=3059160 RepID=A0ABP1CI80_9APHY
MGDTDNGSGRSAGWPTMVRTIRGVDEAKIKDYKEDIDTLLAGLFSAITTAFLIESYKGLQEDPSDATNLLLYQMVFLLQNSSGNAPSVTMPDMSCILTSSCPFDTSLASKRVNVLWFASLILSLVTASFGMLVKQWLREFLAGEYTSPQARLRTHFFRYPGLLKWKVFELVALLPILLQLSLGLFLVGLCFFTGAIHPSVAQTSLILVSFWAFLILMATIAPVFSPRCPYKTTFLKAPMKYARSFLNRQLPTLYDRYSMSHFKSEEIRQDNLTTLERFEEEYFAFHAQWHEDLEILLAVDAMQLDDELLATTIAGSLTQTSSDHARLQTGTSREQNVMYFIKTLIENRIQQTCRIDKVRPDFYGKFSLQAWSTIVRIVGDILAGKLRQYRKQGWRKVTWEGWMEEAVTLLLSRSEHALPRPGPEVLALAFEVDPAGTAELLCSRVPLPDWAWEPENAEAVKNTDVLADMLMREMRGVFELLHGQALLDALFHLLRCRFHDSTNSTSVLTFFSSHSPGSSILCIPYGNAEPVELRISTQGSLRMTLSLLVEEVDKTICTPCVEQPSWFKEACRIIFEYRTYWTNEHTQLVTSWLSRRPSLDWCLQMAFPLDDISAALSCRFRDILPEIYEGLEPKDRQTMVERVKELLRDHYTIGAISGQNEMGIDYLVFCRFLLETLWKEQQLPVVTGVQSKARVSLSRAWSNLCPSLAHILQVFLTEHWDDTRQDLAKHCIVLAEQFTNVHTSSGPTFNLTDVVAALNRKFELVRKAANNWRDKVPQMPESPVGESP